MTRKKNKDKSAHADRTERIQVITESLTIKCSSKNILEKLIQYINLELSNKYPLSFNSRPNTRGTMMSSKPPTPTARKLSGTKAIPGTAYSDSGITYTDALLHGGGDEQLNQAAINKDSIRITAKQRRLSVVDYGKSKTLPANFNDMADSIYDFDDGAEIDDVLNKVLHQDSFVSISTYYSFGNVARLSHLVTETELLKIDF